MSVHKGGKGRCIAACDIVERGEVAFGRVQATGACVHNMGFGDSKLVGCDVVCGDSEGYGAVHR